MTRIYIGGFATAITMAATAICTTAPALAKSDNAAVITKDGMCVGFVPSPQGGYTEPLLEEDSCRVKRRIDTKSGVEMLIGHFDIPEDQVPSRITRMRGFPCSVDGQATTDSQMLATPGGHAVLVCKVRL